MYVLGSCEVAMSLRPELPACWAVYVNMIKRNKLLHFQHHRSKVQSPMNRWFTGRINATCSLPENNCCSCVINRCVKFLTLFLLVFSVKQFSMLIEPPSLITKYYMK